MTNLIASVVVSLVTNTSEVWPQKLVPMASPLPQGPSGAIPAVFHGRWVDDKTQGTKTIVTTAKEITTLRFDWNGAREVVSERILWQSNRVVRMETVWK
jgi:hypothetical protein